jgi:hypothetical protein
LEINQLECTKLGLQLRIMEEREKKLMKNHQELTEKISKVEKQAQNVAETFLQLREKGQEARAVVLKNREIETVLLEKEHEVTVLQQSKSRLERQLINKDEELRDEARQNAQLKSELRNSKQKHELLNDHSEQLQRNIDVERSESHRKFNSEKQIRLESEKQIENLTDELENQKLRHQKEMDRLSRRLIDSNSYVDTTSVQLSQMKTENRKLHRQVIDQTRQHNNEIEYLSSLLKKHYPDLSYFHTPKIEQ